MTRWPASVVLAALGVSVLAVPRAAAQEAPPREFVSPRIDGVALDWCLKYGAECGEPAANAFCRREGFERAERFVPARGVGRSKVLSNGQLCQGEHCVGFRMISCAGRGPTRPAPGRGQPARPVGETPPPARERNPQPGATRTTPPQSPSGVLRETPAPAGSSGRARLTSRADLQRLLPVLVGPSFLTEVQAAHPGGYSDGPLAILWPPAHPQLRFRWRTRAPGTAAAMWESANVPFPPGAGRGSADGHLASGRLNLGRGDDWRPFAIEASTLLGVPSIGGARQAAREVRLTKPRVVYLRVKPLDDQGRPLAGPCSLLRITFLPPLPIVKALSRAPSISVVSYMPLQPYAFGYECNGVAVRDVGTVGIVWKKGQHIDLCASSDSSFLDDIGGLIGDAAGGLWSLAKGAADWASQVYNGLKQKFLDVVVDGLKSTVGCGDACQWVTSAALDAGLAALGMPPSLPNFDQLVSDLQDQGIEAVAQQISTAAASQGVPLPPEAAEYAVEQLVNKAKGSSASGSGGAFWRLDPAGLYHPAVVVLEARNTDTSRATAPVILHLDPSDPKTVSNRFHGAVVPLPSLQPGTSLRFSIELTPEQDPAQWMTLLPKLGDYVKGLDIDVDAFEKQRDVAWAALKGWTVRYTQGSFAFRLGMEAKPGEVSDYGTLGCPASPGSCGLMVNTKWPGQ